MSELHTNVQWLVRQAHGPVRARLICLPYAGGNARVFHGWAESLRGVEILAVEAPGKGKRVLEQPCDDIDVYCKALMTELAPVLAEPLPYSFFGHSNGAIVAFEICCRLQTLGAPLPQQLLLSACGAPWSRAPRRYSALDDDAFKALLRDFDATPPAILANDALLDLLLPGLRADFAIGDFYESKWPALRGVASHVFYGTQDSIPEAEIFAWQQRIGSPVGFEPVQGGHFYIHDERDALLAAIARQLSVAQQRDTTAMAI